MAVSADVNTTQKPLVETGQTTSSPINLKVVYGSHADPIDVISGFYYTARFNGSTVTVPEEQLNQVDPTLSMSDLNSDLNRLSQMTDFGQDISQLQYHIPPAFKSSLLLPLPQALQTNWEHLKLRLRMLTLINQVRHGELLNDALTVPIHTEILASQPEILKAIALDPDSFHPSLLRGLVEVCLSQEYLRGLDFGKKIMEAAGQGDDIASEQRFADLSTLAHLLLFPTVYDDEHFYTINATENANVTLKHKVSKSIQSLAEKSEFTISVEISRRNALETMLRNAKTVLPMIRLE
jgi:hypothetical protein